MNKSEFYKKLIDVHRSTGQGLSGLVRVAGNEESQKIGRFLDELIQEGLIERCDTGGSLGHPESNIFYVPTKGYNVWKDDGGQTQRFKGRYLNFIRFYLGVLVDEDRKDISDNDDTKMKRLLNPSMQDFIREPNTMDEYTKWLKRNNDSLKEMIGLDDFYEEPEINLSDDELVWLKDRKWYIENKSIGLCLKQSIESMEKANKKISINKELIGLYKSDSKKYKEEIKKSKDDIENCKLEILKRKRVHKLFESIANKKSRVQEIIK